MKKKIFISHEPTERNVILENTMIALQDQCGLEAVVEKGEDKNLEDYLHPIVYLCNETKLENENTIELLKKLYSLNQPIILYKPTKEEVNRVYMALEEKEYFQAPFENDIVQIFGIKKKEDNLYYILEENSEVNTEEIEKTLINFISGASDLTKDETEYLNTKAQISLENTNGIENNLAILAKKFLITKSGNIKNKRYTFNYYITSCHKFDSTSKTEGEDWYFIEQYCILDASIGYDKYWAGSRVKINGESWYVGQGEVCLNYIDYYKMKNSIPDVDGSSLIYVEPQAVNDVTEYTISESINIGGSIGVEVEGKSAKGKAELNIGAGFSNSYTIKVRDCKCIGRSLIENKTSSGWEYVFKRAKQNREAGKWQRLHDPAELSYSTFSTLNTWVWKVPTSKRKEIFEFKSEFEVGMMNTITRYSGSQSPKDIPTKFKDGENKETYFIQLNKPPLLVSDIDEVIFDQGNLIKQIIIGSQGSWKLDKEELANWCHVDKDGGFGEATTINIVVDSYPESLSDQIRKTNLKLKNSYGDELKIEVIQLNGKL